jgi:hypothetical protein
MEINGRDLALYKSYLENRYQILYNDEKACNKVPSLTKVLRDVPQGCVPGTVLFFIYIYIYIYIQGVTGGTDQTSGGCSLC